MFQPILLAILAVSSYNAIIQVQNQVQNTGNSNNLVFNPVIRLSQNFIYSLTFPSSSNFNNTNSVLFTLVSNNQSCGALFCYYGWVHNFSLNGKTYDGYALGKNENPMVFLIKGFTNKTYSVTMDRNQSIQKIAILDLCAKVANPLASQISSLNPFNKSPKTQSLAVYRFISLIEAFKDQELKNAINLQELSDGTFANTTFLGINKTKSDIYSSFTDVLAVDSSSNIILGRQVIAVEQTNVNHSIVIQLKLKSSTKFSNILSVAKLVSDISSEQQNSIYSPILPQYLQLSQIKLSFPGYLQNKQDQIYHIQLQGFNLLYQDSK